jgi:hypothetical protein
MNITREKLKQIIKEEIEESLKANTNINDIRQKFGLEPVESASDEEIQAALAGEERPITWDVIEELMKRIDRLELKVYKGVSE